MLKTKNLFRGISLGSNGCKITHLQYADDVILFLNDDYSSVLGAKRILQCFHVLFGMKVNFSKSQVYGFHTEQTLMQKCALKLQCLQGRIPFKYLGAYIRSLPTSIKFLDPLIERFKRKVTSYQASKISMAGKAVLLQAAIDSTPIY